MLRSENNIPFSLKGLAKGIYFINIAAEGGSLTKKLVVD
ncbi:MAG: T9SS type A sorting domain-containing protein [Bacteroidetes bacterium]|nr:T9SS type A sorting domain-containing protein [Bacteroidota bacterium]